MKIKPVNNKIQLIKGLQNPQNKYCLINYEFSKNCYIIYLEVSLKIFII